MARTLELLASAYDAFIRASAACDADATPETERAERIADSRLYRAALEAGMLWNEPSHQEWAAIRISRWMVSGVRFGVAA